MGSAHPEQAELPVVQRIAIEQMKLRQSVKDILLENNNSEIYQMLGVQELQSMSAHIWQIC